MNLLIVGRKSKTQMRNMFYWAGIISILICLPLRVSAQSYEQMWKQVEVLEQKQLPKSAIQELRKIYEYAKQEKNVSQMMKAHLTRASLCIDITPDSLDSELSALKAWMEEEKDTVYQAILNNLLVTYGVSDLELTAAYAAIADGGQYRKPVFYTKVTDSKGNVLIDNTENKATQVFKASTASLLTNAMEDVLEKGTGVAARLDNMHAAGKTGTTNEAKDLVFAGFTPYYTAAIWATYDTHAEFPESDREFHKRLWAKVMNEIHEGLADMDFETSATVQEATICTKTGLLARSSSNT